jgi:hypothetical protein
MGMTAPFLRREVAIYRMTVAQFIDQLQGHEGVMIHDLLSQQPQGQADDKPEVVLATISQRSDDTVLEVVMIHKANGATSVELRSLVWGNGLGWYRQHTLQLDETTARNLIQALGIVQRRVEHQGIDALAHNVLPFPRSHQKDAATA